MVLKSARGGLSLIGLSVASLVASAQTATLPTANAEEQLSEITVTGSRIRKDAFTSASPIQIITTERSTLEGLQDTAQVLQEAAVASGSGQINTLFGGFIVDGGPGVQTISLRGLGAQRTLVLLNGRRLPPAGVGGTVGPVDLNIIPNSIVNRIELLKDGASSIYGSDAVAGVVNVITKTRTNGGRINGQYNSASGGGDQYTFDGTYGWAGDRGGFSISAEYYKISRLKLGERPQAACGLDLLSAAQPGNIGAIARYGVPARHVETGDSTDLINPFTGKPVCWSTQTGWGNIYVPTPQGWVSRGSITNLPRGPGYVPATTGSAAAMEPTAAPGWRRFSSFEISEPTPAELNADLIPKNDRRTVYAQGDFSFSPAAELYGEVLLNQRKSTQSGVRQLFPNISIDSEINPTGYYFFPIVALLPTISEQDVKVGRVLSGLRGDIGKWRYDAYVSHSRSDADYDDDVIPYDRLEAATGTYQDQASDADQGEVLPGGVCGPGSPAGCVPFNSLFTVDGLRYGNYAPPELAYIRAVDHGNTKFDQTIFEAQTTGDLFELPAGPLGAAFGVSFRRDKINDVPGEFSLNSNSWGQSTSGITKGSDNVKEVYTELELPLLRGMTAVQDLSLNLSGRYSDYKSVGGAFTYKAGLNWKINDLLRMRSTYGTSFRAPALYELYLNNQVSFLGQFAIDPCINYADPDRNKSPTIQANCAAAGIPGDYAGTGASAQITTGGGLGLLDPETSNALSVGIVITPPGTGLSFAVDYWDIKVEDEISGSSAGIVGRCYSRPDYDPANGFCTAFTRIPPAAPGQPANPNQFNITDVNAQYRNIPTQRTKGFDANLSYERNFSFGKVELEGEATRTTYDKAELYPSQVEDYNGLIGEPRWTANAQVRLKRGDWTFAWSTNFIGGEDNIGYQDEDGFITDVSYAGPSTQITSVKNIYTHDFSVRYKGDDYEVTFGATNIMDRQPPQISYDVAGTARLGTIPLTSQYYDLIQGRTAFVSLSRKF